MILDEHGNPMELSSEPTPEPVEPQPHRFGFFKIPDDARLSMARGLEATEPYPWVGYFGCAHRDQIKTRAEQ